MISHDKAHALISARYDQLLSAAETRDLHEHLASCAACRRFAADADLLVNGLRTLPSLPPSPRVSRAVRDGIRGSAESPWGWLGQALRIAGSPTLAVASSLVLVAALAFIIVLALRPLSLDEQPRATISALADVIETPTTEPERTPFTAPTVAPTEPVVAAPTQEPTPEPTARLTNVAPPTQTPVPTSPAEPEPTLRSILEQEQEQATVAPAGETPEPTVAPPPVATQPPAPVEEPTTVIEAANQAVTAEPTAPPLASTTDGAPFIGQEPVATEEGEGPPALAQPTIMPGGPEGGAVGDAAPTAEPNVADNVAIMTEPEPTAVADAGEPPVAEPEPEPTVPPAAPTSTPVEIVAAESAPAPAAASDEPPQLPERSGNEAIGMDGESMVAEIQATVQAGLADDSGPPPVPTSAPPPTSVSQADLTPGTGDPALTGAAGAEITGAPASDSLATGSEPITSEAPPSGESAPVVTDAAPAAVDPAAGAAVELAPTAPPLEQAPVAPPVSGAPEPGWPGIGGGGTQFLSNAGYSAIANGGAVTVFGPDGTSVGWVGSGVPIWSPGGTSLLVIGGDGLGAVWDASGGTIPVERAAAAARDIPVGWYGGEPLVQRVYFDGSGLVELRVVPLSGAGGYALGTATADSVFGEGVTAARLSPDGGQISFVSGGQLYIAPVSDPGNASPAG